MALKILYWIIAQRDVRMLYPLIERNDIEQAIAFKLPVSVKGTQIKRTFSYSQESDLIKIIDNFKPDVVVQYNASRLIYKQLKDRGIKSVFSAHGVWPESDENKIIVADDFFKTFDLACGASYKIKKIFNEHSDPNTPVEFNTLTQFDNLYKYSIKHKEHYGQLRAGADKVVVFFGHNIARKTDKLRPYDMGYKNGIKHAIHLAQKNNWMLYVKPKNTEKWINALAANKKNVVLLPATASPYKYFCADAIITSARSTIEVEAALLKKPIIRIFMPTTKLTDTQLSYEYDAMDFGAEYLLKDMNFLRPTLMKCFEDPTALHKKQEEYIKHLGIKFDGKASFRFIEAIKRHCK